MFTFLFRKIVFFKGLIAFLNSAVCFSETPYFQQEVNYTITVSLDDKKHELFAQESIEYINNSPDELSFIWMHIWPNAYKNNNTALAKQLLEDGNKKFYYADDSDRGFIDGLEFKINGQAVKWQYDSVHIDICKIFLNEPLKNGGRITISTPFHVKIPLGKFSRLGHIQQSYQITQWYPKPAVYDNKGWHQMPYLTMGEFYSEYGSFDVSITLPKNYVVGATGDLQNTDEIEWLNYKASQTEKTEKFSKDTGFPISDTVMKTLRYKQSRIHDFAWFADKRYHILKSEVELPHSKRKVITWAMFTNAEAELWRKGAEYVNNAIYYYSLWNGDYPYNQMTAVDGALSAGGGMEYPNVTVIGSSGTAFLLELVIVHEVGHNWFYGILGSNEREHPWMDEGINSFNELRYVDLKHPEAGIMGASKEKAIFRFFDLHKYGQRLQYYLGYMFNASRNLDQPIDFHSAGYTQSNYGFIVYMKTATVFNYLKSYLGDELFDKAMQAYFERWKFRHPYPEDIRKVLEEVTGKNLSWFFDDLIFSTKKMDYKVTSLKKAECVNKEANCVDVLIRNKGGITGPVNVSAIKGDSVVASFWMEGFSGKKKTELVLPDFDKFKIDPLEVIPEVNRHNNTIRRRGILRKAEYPKPKLLFSLDDPNRTQFFFFPNFGWNNYDKMMYGLAIYNTTIPFKKFQYNLMPYYSFNTKIVAGLGHLSYSYYPNSSVLQNINIGLKGMRFSTSDPKQNNTYEYSGFTKIAPEINVQLKKPFARSPVSRTFSYRFVGIRETELFKIPVLLALGTTSALYNELYYSYSRQNALNPFDYKVSLQQGKDFMKCAAEYHQSAEYSSTGGGRKIHLRLFAGAFFYNKTNDGRINWRMDGQSGRNDYTYDQLFLGRMESEGFLSQQLNENQGGFKVLALAGQSNQWLAAINLKIDLPVKLPVGIFVDAGVNPYKTIDSTTGLRFNYDMGLHIWLVRNFCEIYFPFLYSEDIKAALDANKIKFPQTIRFTLNLNKLNLIDLTQSISL